MTLQEAKAEIARLSDAARNAQEGLLPEKKLFHAGRVDAFADALAVLEKVEEGR